MFFGRKGFPFKKDLNPRAHRKSLWRLIGGVLILAGVSSSLRRMPSPYGPLCVIAYLVCALFFAAIGVWLLISSFRKR